MLLADSFATAKIIIFDLHPRFALPQYKPAHFQLCSFLLRHAMSLNVSLYNLLIYNYDIPGHFVIAQPFRHSAFSQPSVVVTLPINFLLSVADL